MKNHRTFTITASPFIPDLISGQLWSLDIEGIDEQNTMLIVFADEKSGVNKNSIENELQKLTQENLIETFSIEEGSIEEVNWNEEWERNLKPIRVSDNIIIKQSFKEVETQPNELVITIDPKMSFGTGEHETTKLVLQLLEECDIKNKSGLDIGSGTAILAIASAKLGAVKIVALDNDQWCFDNGIENVKTNNVESFVDIRLGELDDVKEKDFDFILANINTNVLIDIASGVSAKLKDGGFIILSGLLTDDEDKILKEYTKKGCAHIQTLRMNEWTALKFKKTK